MTAIMEADVTAKSGQRGKHDRDRVASRHGHGPGSVTLGGRRVPVQRPRMRASDGSGEPPVPAYELFSSTEVLGRTPSSGSAPAATTLPGGPRSWPARPTSCAGSPLSTPAGPLPPTTPPRRHPKDTRHEHPPSSKLPAAQIRDLTALRWLQTGESVILYGPVGVRKSHAAEALAHLAIRAGAEARFTKTSRTLAELAGGHADGTWTRRLRELARPAVLDDDFAMRELTPPKPTTSTN